MSKPPSRAELEDAILDTLVDYAPLNREALSLEVIDEWSRDSAIPDAEQVRSSIRDLEERKWLVEREEVLDGERFTAFWLTDAGKAEWRRRNPLAERLPSACFAEGAGAGWVVYAPSEELADRFIMDLSEMPNRLLEVNVSAKTVSAATYTLEETADVIDGVRVEYPKVRRPLRPFSALSVLSLLVKIVAREWIETRRARRDAR